MPIEFNMIAVILLPLVVALVISFLSTPIVKSFAYKLGAIDVPKDERRMHKVPIPRRVAWLFSWALSLVCCCL